MTDPLLDPVMGIDTRLNDKRFKLFDYYDQECIRCLVERGNAKQLSNISTFNMMKQVEKDLQGVRIKCQKDVWNDISKELQPQISEFNRCFTNCLKQGAKWSPQFLRTPDCRYKCYTPHQQKLEDFVRKARSNKKSYLPQ